MTRILLRLCFSVVPPLPVWILTGNLWLGLLVMVLTYIVIQFCQFVASVKIMAIYDLLSQYLDFEDGEKTTAETLRSYVENHVAFNRKFLKMWRKYR